MTQSTIPHKDLSLGEEVGIRNPREQIDKGGIKELAESIAQRGLLYPLLVWQTEADGKKYNIVLEGQRRYLAIGELAKKKRASGVVKAVPVNIVEAKDAAEARLIALVGNIQREELSSFEIAREIAALKHLGVAQKDIAKKLGKSASYVSRALSAYNKATGVVREAWESGKLPDDDVQHLTKLPGEEQEKRAKEVLKHREKAAEIPGKAREAAAEARKTAKAGNGKAGKEPGQKPTSAPKQAKLSPDKQLELADFLDQAPAKARYLRGIRDGIRIVMGEIGPGELDEEFDKFAKEKGLVRK